MLLTHHFELKLLLTNLQHIPTQQINGLNMVIGQIGIYLSDWFVLRALLCLHVNLFLVYLLSYGNSSTAKPGVPKPGGDWGIYLPNNLTLVCI